MSTKHFKYMNFDEKIEDDIRIFYLKNYVSVIIAKASKSFDKRKRLVLSFLE